MSASNPLPEPSLSERQIVPSELLALVPHLKTPELSLCNHLSPVLLGVVVPPGCMPIAPVLINPFAWKTASELAFIAELAYSFPPVNTFVEGLKVKPEPLSI